MARRHGRFLSVEVSIPFRGIHFLNSYVGETGIRKCVNVSIPFRGIHFLNDNLRKMVDIRCKKCVSIPFRGIHFLNDAYLAMMGGNKESFHPLPGNSFLKQRLRKHEGFYNNRVSIPFRGIHFLNECANAMLKMWIDVSIPFRGIHFLNPYSR